MSIYYEALSDLGRQRKNNEDNWVVDLEQGLFIVSDGMGGRLSGELASQIIVETLPRVIRESLQREQSATDEEVTQVVQTAITNLSQEINTEGQEHSEKSGLGATLVMIMIYNSKIFLAHVGDSRAYLFRKGQLTQMTQDHSLVQLLVSLGEITVAEAAKHPARGQIWRFIGMNGDPSPEIQHVDLAPDDLWLLCSDGLTNLVDDDTIAQIITSGLDLKATCQSLVDAANEAGGKDNITVLLVQYQPE